jgi:putative salt-induced outer membrane protein YdiY
VGVFKSVPARTILPALCVTLLLLTGGVSRAQQPAPPPEPPPRLEATAQFSLIATTGNSSTKSVGLGGDFAYRPDPWVYIGKVAFTQNEDEDELTARSFAGLFRASRKLSERFSIYGQYDYLRDLFAGIEHRHTVEGGVSYLALERAGHRVRLDGALGYQKEIRFDAEDFDSAVAIGGVGYHWQITPTSELSDEARLILTMADAGQWKLDQVAALTAAITSILSLKLSNTIRYANEPVPGFEQTDTITAVALVMKIKRP